MGDYDRILEHGMGGHLPRRDGRMELERTGPHVPAVTLPGLGSAVVTEAARLRMLDADLTGCSEATPPRPFANVCLLPFAVWVMAAAAITGGLLLD